MTSPAPDWADQARRFLAGSGLADALSAFGGLGNGPGPFRGPGTPAPDATASDATASGATASDGAAQEGAAPEGADHGAECRWCPVCAGLAALRGRRPDLLEGLADVLGTAAAVLRAHAASSAAASSADSGSAHAAAPADPPEEHGPAPAPVQRIEVA